MKYGDFLGQFGKKNKLAQRGNSLYIYIYFDPRAHCNPLMKVKVYKYDFRAYLNPI